MASISNDPGGRRRILFLDKNGNRKAIWLGKVSKRLAKEIKTKVESINTATIAGRSIDGDTAEWLGKIDDARTFDGRAGRAAKTPLPKPVIVEGWSC